MRKTKRRNTATMVSLSKPTTVSATKAPQAGGKKRPLEKGDGKKGGAKKHKGGKKKKVVEEIPPEQISSNWKKLAVSD